MNSNPNIDYYLFVDGCVLLLASFFFFIRLWFCTLCLRSFRFHPNKRHSGCISYFNCSLRITVWNMCTEYRIPFFIVKWPLDFVSIFVLLVFYQIIDPAQQCNSRFVWFFPQICMSMFDCSDLIKFQMLGMMA